jgi:RimJ/RimL family protein N-acetyltransferase
MNKCWKNSIKLFFVGVNNIMIYGNRIRLRAIQRNDLPLFVNWLNDPETIKGLSLFRPISIEDEETWFENLCKGSLDERPFVIDVRAKENSWTSIGNLGFSRIDWRVRSAEFGICIGEKSYWNQGYGSEAVHLLLEYGFKTLNLNRIFLRVFATNPRAIRSYEKVGFILEGNLRQAYFDDGKYIDVLIMSVLNSEFA